MFTKLRSPRSQSGGTLVELLIGLAISGVVLAQVCMLWYYSSRAFVAQMNYVDMDQVSQRTLDLLSREIRQCKYMTNYTATKLVFMDYDDKLLTYRFDEGKLIRQKGTEAGKVLLKDCEMGSFSIFQRNPVAGAYDQYPAASAATCKLVEIKWRCTRRLFPAAPVTRESMQSAKIVLRNP